MARRIDLAKEAFARLVAFRPKLGDPIMFRRFWLERHDDISGISGTGTIAQGVRFSNGKVVIQWITQLQSLAIYDSMDEMIAIHGHDGKTTVVWTDG